MKEDDVKKKEKQEGARKEGVSRRDFMKKSATAATVAGITGMKSSGKSLEASVAQSGATPAADATGRPDSKVNRQAVIFAVGDTLIPSEPNDPGYRDLEWYGITDEINRRLEDLPDNDIEMFNNSSVGPLKKKFTELSASQRGDYFNLILKESGLGDEKLQAKLRETFDFMREAVFTIYYQNFPQDHWPRDAYGVPLPKRGDTHQITNPNTTEMVTGWDQAGYAGPLTWQEEERRRKYFKKIRWQE